MGAVTSDATPAGAALAAPQGGASLSITAGAEPGREDALRLCIHARRGVLRIGGPKAGGEDALGFSIGFSIGEDRQK
jgi:hypothetical protein